MQIAASAGSYRSAVTSPYRPSADSRYSAHNRCIACGPVPHWSNRPHEIAGRRPGDPPVLIGDAARARAVLGWQPGRSDVTIQIEDAWRWMRAR
jgi:hypothetical protein